MRDAWRAAGARNTTARRGWLKRLARHAQASDFERVMNGRLPDGWRDVARAERARLSEIIEPLSPLAAGHRFSKAMASFVPDLVGAAVSTAAREASAPLPGAIPLDAGDYSGRHIAFRRRGNRADRSAGRRFQPWRRDRAGGDECGRRR